MNNFDLEEAALCQIVAALGDTGIIADENEVIKGDNPEVNPTKTLIHMNGFDFELHIVMQRVVK